MPCTYLKYLGTFQTKAFQMQARQTLGFPNAKWGIPQV